MLFLLRTITTTTAKKNLRLLIVTGTLVLLTVTLQDYIHSCYHHYSFYLSESILFNSFWIWFLPIFLAFTLLEKKYRLIPVPLKLSLFILAASLLHIISYAFSVYFISATFYTPTYDLEKMLGYTLSQDFYKYLLVYGLAGILYLRKKTVLPKTPVPLAKKEKVYPFVIVTGSGRSSKCIPVEDIYYIHATSPYITIHTSDKKHLHTQTLKTILTQLDPCHFVQVHKSSIVNIKRVVTYKSRLNGDYDLFLENGREVRLSRTYSGLFKEKLGKKSST